MGDHKTQRAIFILLAALAVFILFFKLGNFPFIDYDEASYAYIAREMMGSEHYLTLTRDGSPWIDKPPLMFWAMAASAKIFGFNELGLRFPGAFLGLGAIALTFLITLELTKNFYASSGAAAILLATGQFIYSARQVRLDVPVSFFILLALYFFIKGRDKNIWYLGFGPAIALGVMTKSIIGLMAIPIALIFAAAYKDWRFLRNGYFYFGLTLMLAFGLPWHIYEYKMLGNEFFNNYIYKSLFQRFSEPIIGSANSYALYYLKMFFKYAEPFAAILPPAIIWFIARRKQFSAQALFPSAALASFLFIFVLFNLATTKLFYYMDPVYPFLAMFLGSVAAIFYENIKNSDFKVLAAISGVVILLSGFVATLWQVFSVNGRDAEFALAKEEKVIAGIIKSENKINKVYTSNFYNYETLRYYALDKKINISPLKKDIDLDAFFLIMPTKILELYELSPVLTNRARKIYGGDILTAFTIDGLK